MKTAKFFFKNRGSAPGTVIYEGDTPPNPTDISSYIISDKGIIKQDETPNAENMREKDILWIRITGLADTDKIMNSLKPFSVNNLTMEDIFETFHSPKQEETQEYMFIIMRSIVMKPLMRDNQISFILKDNILITLEEFVCDEFEIVMRRINKRFANFYERGAEYVLYALIDSLIDNYLAVLNKIDAEVDALEDAMTADISLISSPKDSGNLFGIKRRINFLSRHTRSSYDIVNNLLKRSSETRSGDGSGIDITPYYEDLFEHSAYLNEAIQSCKDSIRSLYDENMSRMQIKSNNFVNILTMLSTLMLPSMVIGGIFGMNFSNIPGLSSPYGFALSVAAMLGTSAILAWFFKKKKFF